MAGKSKNMSQIKQLLLLKKNRVSNRKAASIIGINKETVNNYTSKVNADKLSNVTFYFALKVHLTLPKIVYAKLLIT